MPRSITIAATTCAAAFLTLVMMRVTAPAQSSLAQGPAPTVNQKAISLKVIRRDYDNKKLLSGPALSEEANIGRALWQQRCAYCHDGVGQATYKTPGPWMDSDTVEEMGADGLKQIISGGISGMPAFKYDLDAQQMNDLIEFLKTVPPNLKPTPAQLAGKLPASTAAEK